MLDVYESVGAVLAGELCAEDLAQLERVAVPTVGSCPGQFSANTLAMIAETLGIAPLQAATIPAVHAERQTLARRAGERVMGILADGGPLPRDLVTRQSLENACAAVSATGGSTKTVTHIPRVRPGAGVPLTAHDRGAGCRAPPRPLAVRRGG